MIDNYERPPLGVAGRLVVKVIIIYLVVGLLIGMAEERRYRQLAGVHNPIMVEYEKSERYVGEFVILPLLWPIALPAVLRTNAGP